MIPSNIKRDHIIKAIEYVDTNGIRLRRKAKKYYLVHKGKKYPPKFLVSIANKFVNGEELDSHLFSCGKGTNTFLNERGFEIKKFISNEKTQLSVSKSIIIANITWNPYGWRNIYVNPKAGHRYAREFPGHESLNFKFNKPIDKNGKVCGYAELTAQKNFQSGGVVIFYSRNLKTKEGEMVGVYGNAEILRPPIKSHCVGFEGNILLSNIIADETCSMLFPMPLNDKKYKRMLNTTRLVPQCGFRYVNDGKVAKAIIGDEIIALVRSGIRQNELTKLLAIYEYITGEPYGSTSIHDEDMKEQEYQNESNFNIKPISLPPGKMPRPKPKKYGETEKYPRNPCRANNALEKAKFKCELNPTHITFINKKSNRQYMEAHHLIPMSKQGSFDFDIDVPENIICLCPTCHRKIHLAQDNDKKAILSEVFKNRKSVLQERGIGLDINKLFSIYSIE